MSEALDAVHEVGPLAAKRADESERLGHLSGDVVEALHATQLFRVIVPDELGGLGLTLPESVEVSRQMSTYDASTGWTLSILGSGPVFGRFLGQRFSRRSSVTDPRHSQARSTRSTDEQSRCRADTGSAGARNMRAAVAMPRG